MWHRMYLAIYGEIVFYLIFFVKQNFFIFCDMKHISLLVIKLFGHICVSSNLTIWLLDVVLAKSTSIHSNISVTTIRITLFLNGPAKSLFSIDLSLPAYVKLLPLLGHSLWTERHHTFLHKLLCRYLLHATLSGFLLAPSAL